MRSVKLIFSVIDPDNRQHHVVATCNKLFEKASHETRTSITIFWVMENDAKGKDSKFKPTIHTLVFARITFAYLTCGGDCHSRIGLLNHSNRYSLQD